MRACVCVRVCAGVPCVGRAAVVCRDRLLVTEQRMTCAKWCKWWEQNDGGEEGGEVLLRQAPNPKDFEGENRPLFWVLLMYGDTFCHTSSCRQLLIFVSWLLGKTPDPTHNLLSESSPLLYECRI